MRLILCCALLLLTACEGAVFDKTEVPPPVVPHNERGRVAQYCTHYGSSDLGAINEFLRQQGDAGWQLVGLGGSTATVYCFKTAGAPQPVSQETAASGAAGSP
jgi:hypothetical protein